MAQIWANRPMHIPYFVFHNRSLIYHEADFASHVCTFPQSFLYWVTPSKPPPGRFCTIFTTDSKVPYIGPRSTCILGFAQNGLSKKYNKVILLKYLFWVTKSPDIHAIFLDLIYRSGKIYINTCWTKEAVWGGVQVYSISFRAWLSIPLQYQYFEFFKLLKICFGNTGLFFALEIGLFFVRLSTFSWHSSWTFSWMVFS